MTTHRVLIVGGGLGALHAAKALKRAPVEVTLVDRANHHLFRVLRRQANARVLLAEVEGFDLDARVAHATTPDGDELELGYDSLIVAGARDVRSQVLRAFELAELATDPAERDAWLRFAVVGGGPTGIELAGQIAALARRTLSPDLRATISLVEGGPRVLPEFPETVQRRAVSELAKLGVDIWQRARVVDADDEGIDILSASGALLRAPARTILWANGVQASPLITVNDDLTLPGDPEVFAISDIAALVRRRLSRISQAPRLQHTSPSD